MFYAPQPALPASTANPYPPCSDTHANAFSGNSFLLILMQTPRGWGMPSPRPNSIRRSRSLPLFAKNASLFAALCQERNLSPFFPIVCALFAKKTGVYPSCSLPRGPFPRGQSGIRPGSSCLSAPSETEDCRLMTDNFSISSIPGTFLPAPAYLSTTARSSTAPGTRLGRLR